MATNMAHLTSGAGEVRTQLLDPLQILSDRERRFVDNITMGMKISPAATAAGFKNAHRLAGRQMKKPHVARAIAYLAEENRKAAVMDRKKVMAGFLEAIEMAKVQGDPSTMVAGWREMGRMCGLYEPEKKSVDVNITAKRMIDKLETLTTSELLDYIEGESKDVTPVSTPVSALDQT
jgi:hypothetical protein